MAKKKIAPRKGKTANVSMTAEDQEKVLQQLQKTDKKKKVQRVTVDFPFYLYEKMKDETDILGDSLRNFVVQRVREYFDKK